MEAASGPGCSWEICWAAPGAEGDGVRPRPPADLVPVLPGEAVDSAASTEVEAAALEEAPEAAEVASMAEAAAAVAVQAADDRENPRRNP